MITKPGMLDLVFSWFFIRCVNVGRLSVSLETPLILH